MKRGKAFFLITPPIVLIGPSSHLSSLLCMARRWLMVFINVRLQTLSLLLQWQSLIVIPSCLLLLTPAISLCAALILVSPSPFLPDSLYISPFHLYRGVGGICSYQRQKKGGGWERNNESHFKLADGHLLLNDKSSSL